VCRAPPARITITFGRLESKRCVGKDIREERGLNAYEASGASRCLMPVCRRRLKFSTPPAATPPSPVVSAASEVSEIPAGFSRVAVVNFATGAISTARLADAPDGASKFKAEIHLTPIC
jgi:hypothetical protein